jgi:hypothetical protein
MRRNRRRLRDVHPTRSDRQPLLDSLAVDADPLLYLGNFLIRSNLHAIHVWHPSWNDIPAVSHDF